MINKIVNFLEFKLQPYKKVTRTDYHIFYSTQMNYYIATYRYKGTVYGSETFRDLFKARMYIQDWIDYTDAEK